MSMYQHIYLIMLCPFKLRSDINLIHFSSGREVTCMTGINFVEGCFISEVLMKEPVYTEGNS